MSHTPKNIGPYSEHGQLEEVDRSLSDEENQQFQELAEQMVRSHASQVIDQMAAKDKEIASLLIQNQSLQLRAAQLEEALKDVIAVQAQPEIDMEWVNAQPNGAIAGEFTYGDVKKVIKALSTQPSPSDFVRRDVTDRLYLAITSGSLANVKEALTLYEQTKPK